MIGSSLALGTKRKCYLITSLFLLRKPVMLSNSKCDVVEIPTSIHGNMLLSEKVITDDKYTEQEIASMVHGRF